MGSLLECQVDKSEESAANCEVGSMVGLFVGGIRFYSWGWAQLLVQY